MSTNYGLTKDARSVWHCDFYSGGTRFQRSTFTTDRAAAEEYCRKLDDGAWREKKLGEAPRLIWKDAVKNWFEAKTRAGNKDLYNDQLRADALAPHLDDIWLHEMTAKQCDDALDELEDAREWKAGTRNRHSSFIKRVLNALRSKYQVAVFKLAKVKEKNRDVRFLTREEATILLHELPLHLKRIVEFSLITGLRQSNVTGLLWRTVDLVRQVLWIPGSVSKSGEPIQVSLPPRAVEILREAKACAKHGHDKLVFTYFKAAIQYPAESAWDKALVRAGIANFRWHDLRHTWASWHVMGWWSSKGIPTPLAVLQVLGGWHSVDMVQRYAHLAPNYTTAFIPDMPVVIAPPREPLKLVVNNELEEAAD